MDVLLLLQGIKIWTIAGFTFTAGSAAVAATLEFAGIKGYQKDLAYKVDQVQVDLKEFKAEFKALRKEMQILGETSRKEMKSLGETSRKEMKSLGEKLESDLKYYFFSSMILTCILSLRR